MSIQLTDAAHVALFCNTTDWAFGPVFNDEQEAVEFLRWTDTREPRDLRTLTDKETEALHHEWHTLTHCADCGERLVGTTCEGCK